MERTDENNLNTFKIWLLAMRPKTLPAAMGPVIVGTALALAQDSFSFLPAMAALLAALLLQIGSNLANDVFDFKKGKDTKERTGPLRVTQAGLLSPRQVFIGMWFVFALAFLIGTYLIWLGGWPILVIGLSSIICAIIYTGGPFPLGYHGLGEVFVFIFFGPVAVVGTYYVQGGVLNPTVFLASSPVGFLITAILVVNNFRDLPTDKKVGKRTLAVRLGPLGTRVEFYLLLITAAIVPLIMWLSKLSSPGVLLSLLSFLLAPPLIRDLKNKKGAPLNKTLAGTAKLSLVYSLLFSLGLIL